MPEMVSINAIMCEVPSFSFNMKRDRIAVSRMPTFEMTQQLAGEINFKLRIKHV